MKNKQDVFKMSTLAHALVRPRTLPQLSTTWCGMCNIPTDRCPFWQSYLREVEWDYVVSKTHLMKAADPALTKIQVLKYLKAEFAEFHFEIDNAPDPLGPSLQQSVFTHPEGLAFQFNADINKSRKEQIERVTIPGNPVGKWVISEKRWDYVNKIYVPAEKITTLEAMQKTCLYCRDKRCKCTEMLIQGDEENLRRNDLPGDWVGSINFD
jgi:hypothetical protein